MYLTYKLDLFNLFRVTALLYQTAESCGLISIALSYAFIASSYLPNAIEQVLYCSKLLNYVG